MIQKKKLPTAIFTANSRMVEGAMLALREESISIPEDISLVTFEEIIYQKLLTKDSLIKQNALLMGQKAGELVVKRLKKIVMKITDRENLCLFMILLLIIL